MVIILKDFTSKVTKKRYYKDDKTNDFNAKYEGDLESKGFVKKVVVKKPVKKAK